jgi:hypothetical protein
MRRRLQWFSPALLAVWAACSGGQGMSETESPAQAEPEARPESPQAPAEETPTATPAADSDDLDAYAAELGTAVRRGWVAPGRDSATPPRTARVLLELDDDGRLVDWEFRRRSPHGPFNDTISDLLDGLKDSSQRLPLPDSGSPLHQRVLEEGVIIEFADDDA